MKKQIFTLFLALTLLFSNCTSIFAISTDLEKGLILEETFNNLSQDDTGLAVLTAAGWEIHGGANATSNVTLRNVLGGTKKICHVYRANPQKDEAQLADPTYLKIPFTASSGEIVVEFSAAATLNGQQKHINILNENGDIIADVVFGTKAKPAVTSMGETVVTTYTTEVFEKFTFTIDTTAKTVDLAVNDTGVLTDKPLYVTTGTAVAAAEIRMSEKEFGNVWLDDILVYDKATYGTGEEEQPVEQFKVRGVSPESKFGAALNNIIIVTFNKTPDMDTIEDNISITCGAAEGWPSGSTSTPIEGTWSAAGQSVRFTPAENLPADTLITVAVGTGVKTADGSESIESVYYHPFITQQSYEYTVEQINIADIGPVENGVDANDEVIWHTLPMNVWVPDTEEACPVMFFVHGGGWTGGTATASVLQMPTGYNYLPRFGGIAVVSVAYRCRGSNGTFDLGLSDVLRAVDYVEENLAETYNLDMDRIGFYGGSAGAPLAAMAALQTNAKAFVGYNGIYDFVNATEGSFGLTSHNYYGLGNYEDRSVISPIFNIADNVPDVLLLHGTADTTIPYYQSTNFDAAIEEAGGNSQTLLYTGSEHGFFNGTPALWSGNYHVRKFLEEVFNPVEEIEDNVSITGEIAKGATLTAAVELAEFANHQLILALYKDGVLTEVRSHAYTEQADATAVSLTIPADAADGQYTVKVFAWSEMDPLCAIASKSAELKSE